jgi:hypothetical protein
MYDLLKQQARNTWGSGLVVVAKAGLRIWLIGPSQDVDLGEVDPRSPFNIEQLPDGTLRVEVLPPIPEGKDVERALDELRKSFF